MKTNGTGWAPSCKFVKFHQPVDIFTKVQWLAQSWNQIPYHKIKCINLCTTSTNVYQLYQIITI